MKLSVIVRRLRESVPLFKERVDGIIDFGKVDLTRNFRMPCAFVVPAGETVNETTFINEYIAHVESHFSVYVYLPAVKHEITAGYDLADDVRRMLVKSLAGFQVERYGVIYDGFEVLEINRVRIALKVDFYLPGIIGNDETALACDETDFNELHLKYPDAAALGDYVPESVINLKEG